MVDQSDPLVTIAGFATSMDAALAKGALEAAGIHAVVTGEGLGTFSRNRGGISVTELQVRNSDREKAIAELQRLDPSALLG